MNPTHLLDSALDSSLQTEPFELTSDEFVAAHERLSCLLPVGGQGTSVRLLRVKLARIPLWLVVLKFNSTAIKFLLEGEIVQDKGGSWEDMT